MEVGKSGTRKRVCGKMRQCYEEKFRVLIWEPPKAKDCCTIRRHDWMEKLGSKPFLLPFLCGKYLHPATEAYPCWDFKGAGMNQSVDNKKTLTRCRPFITMSWIAKGFFLEKTLQHHTTSTKLRWFLSLSFKIDNLKYAQIMLPLTGTW